MFCSRSHSQSGAAAGFLPPHSCPFSPDTLPPLASPFLEAPGHAARPHRRCELAQGALKLQSCLGGSPAPTGHPPGSGAPAGDFGSPLGRPQLEDAPAPQQLEERVWAFPYPSPECPPPLPMDHLSLAGHECVGLCRRKASSVFPAPGGQGDPASGEGKGETGGMTGPPESQPSKDDHGSTRRSTPVPVLPLGRSHHPVYLGVLICKMGVIGRPASKGC